MFFMPWHVELICTCAFLYHQLSVDFSGPDGTLSLHARGVDPAADSVSCIFSGEGVEALMDMRWHKVALSVQHGAASLHVDCNSIETNTLEPRGVVSTDGHTLLGVQASDAGSVQVRVYAELKTFILQWEEEFFI